MWFWLSIAALICWSGSDLISKIGCSDPSDKRSHLKMVTAVGMVMGLHAAYEIFIGKTEISFDIILTYLPVSLLYIGSMALGYISLRYIELSVSSPICNSSGALVAIMCLITGGIGQTSTGQLIATAIILYRRCRARLCRSLRGRGKTRSPPAKRQPQIFKIGAGNHSPAGVLYS